MHDLLLCCTCGGGGMSAPLIGGVVIRSVLNDVLTLMPIGWLIDGPLMDDSGGGGGVLG